MAEKSAAGLEQEWSLCRLPNFDARRTITAIDTSEVTPSVFAEYVRANRPFKIAGAARHWRAFERWSDREYLISRVLADTPVRVLDAPNVELLGLVFGDRIQAEIEWNLAARRTRTTTFGEFVAAFDREPLAPVSYLYAEALEGKTAFAPLADDVAGFDFVRAPVNRHRFYPLWRAFFGRGYTDWHYHPAQEAVMVQVVGTKRVALLSPSWADWRKISRVARRCMYRYGVDLRRFPEFGTIEPVVVTVEPGDALFIPVYWWHCVESLTQDLGATVALSFDADARRTWDLSAPASFFTARAAVASLSLRQLGDEARRIATSIARRGHSTDDSEVAR